MLLDGEKTGIYSCRVSAYPINQVWPGYQRPIEQTEKSSFVMLGSDYEVVLKIKANFSFDNVVVRPLAKNIESIVSDGVIEVTLPGPGQYSIEFDNRHNSLAVFVNPEKSFEFDKEREVIYFGAGVHYLEDKLKLKDNQVVFIDEGAIDKIMYSLYENYSTKDTPESNGLLLRATYTKPGNYGVDECNIWGCYYYMEALVRMTKGTKGYW